MHLYVLTVGCVANVLAASISGMCLLTVIRIKQFNEAMALVTDTLRHADHKLFAIDSATIQQFHLMFSGLFTVAGYKELSTLLEITSNIDWQCESTELQIIKLQQLEKLFKPKMEIYNTAQVYLFSVMILFLLEIMTASILLYGGNIKDKVFMLPWFLINLKLFILMIFLFGRLWNSEFPLITFVLFFLSMPFRIVGAAALLIVYVKIDLTADD